MCLFDFQGMEFCFYNVPRLVDLLAHAKTTEQQRNGSSNGACRFIIKRGSVCVVHAQPCQADAQRASRGRLQTTVECHVCTDLAWPVTRPVPGPPISLDLSLSPRQSFIIVRSLTQHSLTLVP